VRFRRADGAYRWHLQWGVSDEAGNIAKWYGVLTNIESRKRVEAALRRKEHFLAEAPRLSRTGGFGWNVSTDQHFWSDETFRIFEFDPSSKVSLQMILESVRDVKFPLLGLLGFLPTSCDKRTKPSSWIVGKAEVIRAQDMHDKTV
jgi:hypothetical protein